MSDENFWSLFGLSPDVGPNALWGVLKYMVDFDPAYTAKDEEWRWVIESRRSGSLPYPPTLFVKPGSDQPEWPGVSLLKSSSVFSPDHRVFWACASYGLARYSGQQNDGWAGLIEMVRHFTANKETLDWAAFLIWDELGVQESKQRWGGYIDCLRLLIELPEGYFRTVNAVRSGIGSPVAAVAFEAAMGVDRHRDPSLLNPLFEAARTESLLLNWQAQLRGIRALGGADAFDALLTIAREAIRPEKLKAASRALGWTPRLPDREERIKSLCRSRDMRSARIGTSALSEIRFHHILDEGGYMATGPEQKHRKFEDDIG